MEESVPIFIKLSSVYNVGKVQSSKHLNSSISYTNVTDTLDVKEEAITEAQEESEEGAGGFNAEEEIDP